MITTKADDPEETIYAPGKCTPEMLAYLAEVDAHNTKIRADLEHHRWLLSSMLRRNVPSTSFEDMWLGYAMVVGSRGWAAKRPCNHLNSDVDFAIVVPDCNHHEAARLVFKRYGRETRMVTKVHDMSEADEISLISHFVVKDERVQELVGADHVDIVIMSNVVYEKEARQWGKRFPRDRENEEERAWYVFQMAKFRREGSVEKHRAMKKWLTANL